ncbi:MAG: hypothetical protein QGG97_00360 [Flavobacteriales bacterium]|jgi:hypothetical protein|nr:hypothetical protein [Flavobacteriales bacterium]|tara:strand:+ start:85 stop:666 length:582 start_codon:yes stop_codon:yes gene_type:complete
MKSGYKITVVGQYYVHAGERRKTLKSYRFAIKLPSMDCALSVIKNKILDTVLPKLYSDYAGYRTHDIVDVEAFGDIAPAKAELWQMNRATIISYIQENELPVLEEIYETLMELRQAVEMAEADPDRFKRVQEEKEKDFKLLGELRSLNPELFPEADTKSAEVEGEAVPTSSWKADKEVENKAKKEDVLADLLA